jgi:hypothetical protein
LGIQDQFSLATEAAAQREGLEFIWTAEVFDGHEPCGAPFKTRWIDFLPLTGLATDHPAVDSGVMHPNRNGHYIFSRIISCYLSQNPTRTTTYDGKALKKCAV